jgi:NAD(P)H-flavin reductase
MVPRAATITKVARETEDVFTLSLDVLAWPGGFRWAPGQFDMVWAPGTGEVPISISGSDSRGSVLHTIRAVGEVTNVLAKLRRGDEVGLRGPFGRGWPLEAAHGKDVLVVGGGIGLAPLRPVVREVLARRKEFGKLTVLVGARTPAALLFEKELARWRGRLDVTVEATVDRADASWRGNVGVVTELLARAALDPPRTVAFVCGPEVMIRFVARELEERGVPAGSVFLSLERSMKCAVAWCGHCQLGPLLLCRDGPVFALDRVASLLATREL